MKNVLIEIMLLIVVCGLMGCSEKEVKAAAGAKEVALSAVEKKEALDLDQQLQEKRFKEDELKNTYEAQKNRITEEESQLEGMRERFLYRMKVIHELPQNKHFEVDATKGVLREVEDRYLWSTTGLNLPNNCYQNKDGSIGCN